VNDPYTTYLDLGRPAQFTKQQVQVIKSSNNGEPVISKLITVDAGKPFIQSFDLRENDVFLITLNKLKKGIK